MPLTEAGPAGLDATARTLVARGKGVLAADESVRTITKRFEALGIVSTSESRRAYREMLFTAPDLAAHVSGAIMYDETFHQSASDGTPFPRFLERHGILPGIKVDTGSKALAGAPGEEITEGLDGLRERIAEYAAFGARFAKWRAVLRIGEGMPTPGGRRANAHALARYASLCQEGALVPIVEPEVLMDGDHTLERSFEETAAVLRTVFAELAEQRVRLEAMVLKPNMVVAGKSCPVQPSAEQVADLTLTCLRNTVPAAVPGIAFLSGGQGAEPATRHLDAMNRRGPHPWTLTFSFGRALQDPALAAWGGDAANVEKGRRALQHRCRCNGAACTGEYSPEMEFA